MHLIHIIPRDNDTWFDVRLEFFAGEVPPYAILSHRWGIPEDEVTFHELRDDAIRSKKKLGYHKIQGCCEQALEYGLRHVWIDTCCIDKSSSAELSEAINSMYSWYERARVCFSYLEDVEATDDPAAPFSDSEFRRSGWFTRGWTLQELIASEEVIFFAKDWNSRPIGTKSTLASLIQDITGIRKVILTDRTKVSLASVAEKMSWAAKRRTTRPEDEAYSLMGLFGVNLPTIYGEGRRAFIRLQEEIMRSSTDHSIFTWQGKGNPLGMLATSPSQFADSSQYAPMEYNDFATRFGIYESGSRVKKRSIGSWEETMDSAQPTYAMTNFGLQIQLPIALMSHHYEGYYLGFLACTHGETKDSIIIILRQRPGRPSGHFYRAAFCSWCTIHKDVPAEAIQKRVHPRMIWISGGEAQTGNFVPRPLVDNAMPHQARIKPFRLAATRYRISGIKISGFPKKGFNSVDASAIIHEGEHIVFFAWGRNSLRGADSPVFIFVFGIHNGRVWFHYKTGLRNRSAEDVYHEYDLFTCGDVWVQSDHEIRFFDNVRQRKWNHEAFRNLDLESMQLVQNMVLSERESEFTLQHS